MIGKSLTFIAFLLCTILIETITHGAESKEAQPISQRVEVKETQKSAEKAKSSKDNDDYSIVLKKDRFVLKNFDKSEVEKSGPINEIWTGKDWNVLYQRSGDNINLIWIKDFDEVRLQKNGRNLNQNWQFGNVTISLSKSSSGSMNQIWNLGKATYHYSRSGGNINAHWSTDKPYENLLKSYQIFIDAWCRDNDFLMENAYCLIYNM